MLRKDRGKHEGRQGEALEYVNRQLVCYNDFISNFLLYTIYLDLHLFK